MNSFQIGKKHQVAAFGLAMGLAAMNAWSQTVSLAERRTVTVNGQERTIVSKLSKLNPNTTRVRAVMDLNFTYNFHHKDGKPVIVDMLDRFGTQEGWAITHYYKNDVNHAGINDESKITLAELNKNMVVFANHISNWADQGESNMNKAVQAYMQTSGGGLMFLHGSGDSQSDKWKFYSDSLHPVAFKGHGNITTGTIYRPTEAATHPVMEGGVLSAEKVINGEWHHFSKLITTANSKAEVLMKVDPARCGGCGYTGTFAFTGGNPVSWVIPVGKGKVGYFQEGHDKTTQTELTQAVWDRFFKQMLFYIAGYDTLATTNVVPKYARNQSGVSFDPAAMSVFVEKPGYHKVGLYDVEGKKFDEAAGRGVRGIQFRRHPEIPQDRHVCITRRFRGQDKLDPALRGPQITIPSRLQSGEGLISGFDRMRLCGRIRYYRAVLRRLFWTGRSRGIGPEDVVLLIPNPATSRNRCFTFGQYQ